MYIFSVRILNSLFIVVENFPSPVKDQKCLTDELKKVREESEREKLELERKKLQDERRKYQDER